MRLLDSVAVEERNSPELPALNIPFASQSEATIDDAKKSKTMELNENTTKTVVGDMENSKFQFLYEQ